MKSKRITDRKFFTQPAEDLAQALLGKILCHRISETEILRYRITETEAYPHDDTACHANKFKTGNAVITQNMVGGVIYIHENRKNDGYSGVSFDIVSNIENCGEGVLIRGAINLDDPSQKYKSSPELLGGALKMDYTTLNRIDLCDSKQTLVWIEDDGFVTEGKTEPPKTREGLENSKNISEEDKKRLLRFDLDLQKL